MIENVLTDSPIVDVIYSMLFDDYCAIEAMNASTLKHAAKSPKHLRHEYEQDVHVDTDEMVIGRGVHAMCLEPQAFRDRHVVWSGNRRIGKEWEQFRSQHEGKEIIRNATMLDQIVRTAYGVASDPVAQFHLGDGCSEVVVMFGCEGIQLKGRIDYVSNKSNSIVDLKTSRRVGHQEFGRTFAELQYHVSLAVYQQGWLAAQGELRPVIVMAVESDEPHDVVVYRVDQAILDSAWDWVQRQCRALRTCIERNEWPGIAAGEMQELEFPAWAMPEDSGIYINGERY